MLKAQLAPLSLRQNFFWTFVGNVIYAGCQWGMVTVLAKWGTPEMVGQFALGLAVTAPVIMLTNLQLRAVQATDAKREYAFGDYLALRLIMTTLALLIIAGIALIAGYRRETAFVILAVGLAKAFESISDVFYGLLQQRELMDRIAASMIIKGVLSLGGLGLIFFVTRSVLWAAVGLALSWGLVLLVYDTHNGAFVLKVSPEGTSGTPRPRWDARTLGKLAWLSLPLGVVMMLISLNTNIPRYFVERYWGERELGIFAAMAYLIVAGNTVVFALGQSASPRLAKYYAEGEKAAFQALLLKLVGIGALLGLLGVLVALVAGREILTLLYTPEYGEHADVFVWVMVAAGAGYLASFLGYGMTAARYFNPQLPLFALVAGASALMCWLLVPDNGLRGASMALIVAALVQMVSSSGVVAYAVRVCCRRGLSYGE